MCLNICTLMHYMHPCIHAGEMAKAHPPPSNCLSLYAPRCESIQVDPEKVNLIIGSGGKTIKSIIEESGVDSINIEDGGQLRIYARSEAALELARARIEGLTMVPEVGQIYRDCVVKTVVPYGAFVELKPGKEALIHVSELSTVRLNKPEDFVAVGDTLDVKILEINARGQLRLSHKAVLLEEGREPVPTSNASSTSTATPNGSSGENRNVAGAGKGGYAPPKFVKPNAPASPSPLVPKPRARLALAMQMTGNISTMPEQVTSMSRDAGQVGIPELASTLVPFSCGLSPPRRPLQLAHRHLQPGSRPLQPAHRPTAARPALPARRLAGRCAALCSPRIAPLQPTHRPFAAHRAALCSLRAAPCSPLAAPCSPRAAPLQPAAPPFAARAPPFAARSPPLAARTPPLAARTPPLAPVRRPAAAHSAACVARLLPASAARSPAGRRPPACAALLLPVLLADALVLARRPVGSRTALPVPASSFSAPLVL
ncbi:unnamed protein product [Closterium sp. NIES-53]